MNWFERYGIVGMCFLFFLSIFSVCISPDAFIITPQSITIHYVPIKYIGAAFGFLFLPFGYLIMTISQLLYYKISPRVGTHKKILNSIKNKGYTKLTSDDEEVKIEAVLTYYDRTKLKCGNIESMKFLAPFITKRFDVIAINKSILLASILAFLIAIIIWCFSLSTISFKPLGVIIILLIFLNLVLYLLNNTLEEQIIEVQRLVIENDVEIPEQAKDNESKRE